MARWIIRPTDDIEMLSGAVERFVVEIPAEKSWSRNVKGLAALVFDKDYPIAGSLPDNPGGFNWHENSGFVTDLFTMPLSDFYQTNITLLGDGLTHLSHHAAQVHERKSSQDLYFWTISAAPGAPGEGFYAILGLSKGEYKFRLHGAKGAVGGIFNVRVHNPYTSQSPTNIFATNQSFYDANTIYNVVWDGLFSVTQDAPVKLSIDMLAYEPGKSNCRMYCTFISIAKVDVSE